MKIGLIGFGNMGSAIYEKLKKTSQDMEFFIHEKDFSKLVSKNLSNISLEEKIDLDYIILAVKPKDLEGLKHFAWKGSLISIAAGTSMNSLHLWFGDREIVRLMPNTPLLAGEGISGVYFDSLWQKDTQAQCLNFLSLFTDTVVVEKEELMNAVTALSGSGPAYVYLFIEALSDAGVRCGLSRNDSLKLAAQTVLGSARMVLTTSQHPGSLKDQVTSPAGTTIEGVAALERNGFRNAAMEAVQAAFIKAESMGKKS